MPEFIKNIIGQEEPGENIIEEKEGKLADNEVDTVSGGNWFDEVFSNNNKVTDSESLQGYSKAYVNSWRPTAEEIQRITQKG